MNTSLNIKHSLTLAVVLVTLMSFNLKETLTTDHVSNVKAYDPTGVWDYSATTDEGDITGEMTISKEDGDWEITIQSDIYGTLELENVTLEVNKDKDVIMEGDVEVDGDDIDFYFEFDEDSLEGIVGTPDGDLEITAERQKKK